MTINVLASTGAGMNLHKAAVQVKISGVWITYSYAPEAGRPGYARTMRSLKTIESVCAVYICCNKYK